MFRPEADQPLADTPNGKGDYFLCVARLVPYKRVDLVIDAFNKLGWLLKIIGRGRSESSLRQKAKKNIEFVGGDLTDEEVRAYYQKARAFVFGGVEDFGIVSLEAQACGKPVICPRDSGMAETVMEGKTGELFSEQSVGSLTAALRKFDKGWYDSDFCRTNAEKFSMDRFKKEMKETVMRLATHTL